MLPRRNQPKGRQRGPAYRAGLGATVLLLCLLPACSRPAAAPAATPSAVAGLGLPPCGQPPSPDPDPPPPGAVLPPESRITAVREQRPVIQLNGYVESTPGEVRAWVESQTDLDVVAAVDRGDEVELLVTDSTWKTFISARAICDDASLLAEVIAAEDSGAVIPTPSGSPAP